MEKRMIRNSNSCL